MPEHIRGMRVVFLAPAGVPAPVMLDRLPMILGRSESADIALAFSSISREHARLFVEDEKLYIEDMGSSNGVQVNGEKHRKSELAAGDMVQLGVVEFRVARRGDSTVVIQRAAADEKAAAGKSNKGLIAGVVFGGVCLGLAVLLVVSKGRTSPTNPQPETPAPAAIAAPSTTPAPAPEPGAAPTPTPPEPAPAAAAAAPEVAPTPPAPEPSPAVVAAPAPGAGRCSRAGACSGRRARGPGRRADVPPLRAPRSHHAPHHDGAPRGPGPHRGARATRDAGPDLNAHPRGRDPDGPGARLPAQQLQQHDRGQPVRGGRAAQPGLERVRAGPALRDLPHDGPDLERRALHALVHPEPPGRAARPELPAVHRQQQQLSAAFAA
ncbi:MAG: FHA domain-containing protein [Deltaproteobacteria bacterium]|nr:FHA domain-containing protein [Deltaproteobacteria bacterium]